MNMSTGLHKLCFETMVRKDVTEHTRSGHSTLVPFSLELNVIDRAGRIRYLQEDGSGTTKADLQVFRCTLPTKDPNSDDCLQCGEEQQIGTLIMAGMGMMGTFGAFFLSLLYLCFDSKAATRLDAY